MTTPFRMQFIVPQWPASFDPNYLSNLKEDTITISNAGQVGADAALEWTITYDNGTAVCPGGTIQPGDPSQSCSFTLVPSLYRTESITLSINTPLYGQDAIAAVHTDMPCGGFCSPETPDGPIEVFVGTEPPYAGYVTGSCVSASLYPCPNFLPYCCPDGSLPREIQSCGDNCVDCMNSCPRSLGP